MHCFQLSSDDTNAQANIVTCKNVPTSTFNTFLSIPQRVSAQHTRQDLQEKRVTKALIERLDFIYRKCSFGCPRVGDKV